MKRFFTFILVFLCLAAFVRRAESLYAADKAHAAETAYAAAKPEDIPELQKKAAQMFFIGQLSKSADLYKRLLALDANATTTYLNAAVVYKTLGKNKEAIGLFEKALVLERTNPDIYVELGWCYFGEGQFDRAKVLFQEALLIAPEHPGAMLGAGAALTELKNTDPAIDNLRNLKKLRPNFAAANFLIGRAAESVGDAKNAYDGYVTTMRRDWTFNEARVNLARASQKLGKMEQAVAQWKSLDATEPEDAEIKKTLVRLSPESANETVEAATETVVVEPPKFTPVRSIREFRSGSVLRAGIWTSPMGRAARIKSLVLQSGSNFAVIGKKSKKVYARAAAKEKWEFKFIKGALWLVPVEGGSRYGPFVGPIRLEPEEEDKTFAFEKVTLARRYKPENQPREYRGTLELVPRSDGTFYLISELDLEEYLLGCLPAEMPSAFPIEAQKAQAVIARTQAVWRRDAYKPHRKSGYDLCDSQHCQVYKGIRAESPASQKAVEETHGILLYYKERLAYSYYFSNCGGCTRGSADLRGWGESTYLSGVADGPMDSGVLPTQPWNLSLWLRNDQAAYCNLPEFVTSSEFRWLRIVPYATAERKLNRKYRIGKIQRVVTLARGKSGHVREVLVEGSRRKVVLKREEQIRSAFTIGSLRSTLFMIEAKKDAKGNIREFWISGGGWGHGIGMCQSGAGGLAQKEQKNYEQILSFYYPGTHLNKLAKN